MTDAIHSIAAAASARRLLRIHLHVRSYAPFLREPSSISEFAPIRLTERRTIFTGVGGFMQEFSTASPVPSAG